VLLRQEVPLVLHSIVCRAKCPWCPGATGVPGAPVPPGAAFDCVLSKMQHIRNRASFTYLQDYRKSVQNQDIKNEFVKQPSGGQQQLELLVLKTVFVNNSL
jgi:hypothetical protein